MPKNSPRFLSLILHPLKSTRRWLKRIERQSATRSGGPWTRATEYALLLSLPVAGAVSLLVDELGVTVSSAPVARVRLGRERINGPLVGSSIPVEADSAPWHTPVPVMEVVLERRTIRHGWPFAGRTIRTEPIAMASPLLAPKESVDLSDPDELARIERLVLIDLDGAWEATAAALDADSRRVPEAKDFRSKRRIETRSWMSTLAISATLWLLIFATAAILIRVAQFTTWITTQARRKRIVRRLRDGQCPDCRYDLRAERFPKRCPECGRRIWA